MYHKWWDGANWGPSVTDYEYQGGICTTPPEVVAWGPNRLDVFVLGTDHALYHKWWDGASWGPSLTGWEYLGGTCASAPKAVAWGPNRLDIFVLGMDLALYHKWWDGANWGPSPTDWEYMGGICASEPAVVAWGANRLDVFLLGTDLAIYHKWWDGANWGPSLTDTSTWAASAPVRPALPPGGPTGSMCSCAAPTMRSTTNGGMARAGAPPSPVTNTRAASSAWFSSPHHTRISSDRPRSASHLPRDRRRAPSGEARDLGTANAILS